jgi:subtilisin family serine protease
VIDEGIQVTHPDLDANIWTNPHDPADGVDNDGNGYVDDIRGWDFDANDNSIYDGGTRGSLDDHGTHVAGTIGAERNGSGVVGVNWNVTLISGKFLGRRGGTTANAIRAVDYFTDLKTRHGLNIVATNNSWGGGGFSQALLDAINRGGDAGILFIAAAGNGGSDGVGDDNDTRASYPSNYECTAKGKSWDCVIAVAAITSTGARSGFSNYGANTVDIGAPGSGVNSTTAYNTYSSYSGTSMATPHVSGAAALYKSSHSTATAADVKAAILNSAVSTPSLIGKTVTGGRLNVSGF